VTPGAEAATAASGSQGDAGGSTAESVWVRTVVGWHIAFWAVLAVAGVGTAAAWTSDASSGWDLVALTALLGLGIAYALLAVPAARGGSRGRARAYLALLCLAVGVAVSASPQAGFLLFIAYPQAWFFGGPRREAVAWAVALTGTAAAATVVRVGASPELLREVGLAFGVSLVLSLALGLWISSVIDQSQQRADLLHTLQATRSQLAEVNHAAGVMAERARVAQEIHDTLTQGFTSIVMLSQTARAHLQPPTGPVAASLDAIETTARENLGEARALVAAFTPVPLQESTLAGALERLAERFRAETGLLVECATDAGDTAGLTRDHEVVLLRAAQEAMSNVRRHASASRVVLRLTGGSGEAAVEIADDGAGFVPDRAHGYGLAGMRRRVEQVGGALAVESTPGAGTRVQVRVPVPTSEVGP
jgi:signal transduction histidine kinase